MSACTCSSLTGTWYANDSTRTPFRRRRSWAGSEDACARRKCSDGAKCLASGVSIHSLATQSRLKACWPSRERLVAINTKARQSRTTHYRFHTPHLPNPRCFYASSNRCSAALMARGACIPQSPERREYSNPPPAPIRMNPSVLARRSLSPMLRSLGFPPRRVGFRQYLRNSSQVGTGCIWVGNHHVMNSQ